MNNIQFTILTSLAIVIGFLGLNIILFLVIQLLISLVVDKKKDKIKSV